MNGSAIDHVSTLLERDDAPSRLRQVIEAAFAGGNALDLLLAEGVVSARADLREADSPASAYLTRLTVEGFRGIGPPATLDVTPGPGLTLVIGRNGSGKSSFAEAFEVLLTGDNQRWSRRSAVWREGWENLHHDEARRIEAALAIEGVAGESLVTRSWEPDAGLDGGRAEVQPHGRPKAGISSLGWDADLATYRPFLSYSELGATLDEGPTKLHDAVASVLGLDELAAAEKALRDARLAREKAQKAVLAERDEICRLLEAVDDERARQAVAALRVREPALDVLEQLVLDSGGEADGNEVARLRRVAAVEFQPATRADAVASDLLHAESELEALRETDAEQLLRAAQLLELAISHRAETGDERCPVCATPSVLTPEWAAEAAARAAEQRESAKALQLARQRLSGATTAAHALLAPVPSAVNDARDLLDVKPLLDAWAEWLDLRDEANPARLANGLRDRAAAVASAIAALAQVANAEIRRREDQWRPAALALAAWLEKARAARAAAAAVPDLKRAESWLKNAGVEIRNERFAPIAEEAAAIWQLLRQNSNVELGRIQFEGAGVRRKITLDVTVDGVRGAALGVMSQGELHSLALSLFFPRATLDESPFRFIVIDDPVQSMDPSKVDGLARVLDRAGEKRQVIVFTHDDRLFEAIRRLGITATVFEVTRREGSVVEVREALSPVERHLEDARALMMTSSLPSDVGQRVVPSFCRMALEAAAIEAVRRRRIGRGERHSDVEDILSRTTRLTVFVALALFDDPERGGDVLSALNGQFGGRAVAAFKAVNAGAHEPVAYDLRDLVRDTATLARQIAVRQ